MESTTESSCVVAPSGDDQNADVDSVTESMVREAFITADEVEPRAVAEAVVAMSSDEILDQGNTSKATGVVTTPSAGLYIGSDRLGDWCGTTGSAAATVDAARIRYSDTFVSLVSRVSDSLNRTRTTVGDKCSGGVTLVKERCAKVVVYVEDTLTGAGTKVMSYVPTSVKARVETVCATASQVPVAVQNYAMRCAGSVKRQLANTAVSAKMRYEAVVSNVFLKLEKIKGVANSTLTRTWHRLPDSIKTRGSTIAGFTSARATVVWGQALIIANLSAAKIIAAQEPANAAWKYVSEDPKARTTAKAVAGGATAGGTTGFFAGGAVGAIIGIIPSLFTFGLSIPLGAAIGSGIGFGCGATAGGAVGLASGAAYANKVEVARIASTYKAFVKDQASHIQGRASAAMPTVGLRLRSSGA
jgi:hypothetical protein